MGGAAGDDDGERQRDDRKCPNRVTEKAQARAVVGVRRHKPQLEPRNAPQGPGPQRKPPEPAEDQQQQERHADQRVPPAGERIDRHPGHRRGPRRQLIKRKRQRRRQSDQIREQQRDGLGSVRLQPLARRGDDLFEAAAVVIAYDPAAGEMPNDLVELRRAHGLGEHEQRRGDEIARVRSDLPQHRGDDVDARRQALHGGKNDERRPAHQNDQNDQQRAAADVEPASTDQPEALLQAGQRRILEQGARRRPCCSCQGLFRCRAEKGLMRPACFPHDAGPVDLRASHQRATPSMHHRKMKYGMTASRITITKASAGIEVVEHLELVNDVHAQPEQREP